MADGRRARWLELAPGVALAAALALAAHLAAPHVRRVAAVDATLLALALGLAAGLLLRHPARLERGAHGTLKWALLGGVVLLGFEVNLAFLVAAGPRALVLAVVLVPATLLVFWALARALGVRGDAPLLLGVGTGVCGLSAVVAAGASLRSDEEDVAVAVAAVGLLSAVGVFLYPALGLALGMPPAVYGAWAGASLHAVANAIAAGFALGEDAGRVATLVKMARVALLVPLLVALALALRRRAASPAPARSAAGRVYDALPPMLWGFLAAVLVATFVTLPPVVSEALRLALRAALLLALAALGYTTRLGRFRRAGPRGLALAVLGWAALSGAALAGAWWLYG